MSNVRHIHTFLRVPLVILNSPWENVSQSNSLTHFLPKYALISNTMSILCVITHESSTLYPPKVFFWEHWWNHTHHLNEEARISTLVERRPIQKTPHIRCSGNDMGQTSGLRIQHLVTHYHGHVRNYARIVVGGREPGSCAIAHDFGDGNPPKGVVWEPLVQTGVALRLYEKKWASLEA